MKRALVLLVGLLAFSGGTNGQAQQPSTFPLQAQYRLYFWYRFLPDGSMQVIHVGAGGPATRLRGDSGQGMLEPGDVITHVNGRPVRSREDYERALSLAAEREGKVSLRVRDVRTGRLVDWETVADRVGGAVPLPPAPRREGARHVKVLLIGLTGDRTIGAGCERNLEMLNRYVRGLPNFDAERDLIGLSGEKVTARNILASVARLQVQPTDSLLCYYAGHGAYDPRLAPGDPSAGHFFQIPGGDLPRQRLMAGLQIKGARLTVLLTDTCNVRSSIRAWGGVPVAVNATVSKPFADLLCNYRGVIDVSGTSRDQYGWYNSMTGGCFTRAFVETLAKWDEDKTATWSTFLDGVSDTTSAEFQNRKRSALANPQAQDRDSLRLISEQEDQRPRAFQLRVAPVK